MERIPGTDGCFVCGKPEGKNSRALGIEFFWDNVDHKIITSLKPDKTWCGYDGIVHGGIIAAIMDDAMEQAIFRSAGKMGFTATLSIKYRKHLPVGSHYDLNAFATEIKGKRVKARATIKDQNGNLYSEAEALFILMS